MLSTLLMLLPAACVVAYVRHRLGRGRLRAKALRAELRPSAPTDARFPRSYRRSMFR